MTKITVSYRTHYPGSLFRVFLNFILRILKSFTQNNEGKRKNLKSGGKAVLKRLQSCLNNFLTSIQPKYKQNYQVKHFPRSMLSILLALFFFDDKYLFFLKINSVNLICMLNNELIASKDRLRDICVRFHSLMYYLHPNHLLLV